MIAFNIVAGAVHVGCTTANPSFTRPPMSSPAGSSHANETTEEYDAPASESIAAFCDAIREKKDWYHKLLDPTRRLDLKWAEEAGFSPSNAQIDTDVAAALEELKNEARPIVFYDFEVRLPRSLGPAVAIDSKVFDNDISASLRYASASPHALRQPIGLSEQVGVFISDSLVPKSLHRELVSHFEVLEQIDPPDLHPGSHGKVQDLIHPSLYPFVLRESLLNHASKSRKQRKTFSTEVEMGGRLNKTFESRYGWLPTVFQVAADGRDVHIAADSYINGLGPRRRFPALYRLIEKVFLCTISHLHKTLGFEYVAPAESSSVKRWRDRLDIRSYSSGSVGRTSRAALDELLAEQAKQKAIEQAERGGLKPLADTAVDPTPRTQFAHSDNGDATIPDTRWLHGRQLKVIVKAANYRLTAGQTYEGTWHMEGMPHERIVASVIYYYDTDDAIIDEGLEFRKFRDPEVDFPSTEEFTHEAFSVKFKHKKDGDRTTKPQQGGAEEDLEEAKEDEDGDESDGKEDGDESDEEEEEEDDVSEEEDYPSDWGGDATTSLGRYIDLGSVPTTNIKASTGEPDSPRTGRIISFPNWLQHKVGKLSVAENMPVGEVAKRKILCFFIVEDDEDGPHSDSKSERVSEPHLEVEPDAADGSEHPILDDGANADDVESEEPNQDPEEEQEDTQSEEDPDNAKTDSDFISVHSESTKAYPGLYIMGLVPRVLTAADVPLQMRGTNLRTPRVLLPIVCERLTGQRLPPELVQHILEVGYWGFSREEAERHRRLLMRDRVVRETYRDLDGYSLCEH
ncbi:hypothetical protein DFH06DRAFT_262963 [Mycena polygramma]|nr:hypothetical protein DFH06DRAFT_262963 [Mycena polygramma]